MKLRIHGNSLRLRLSRSDVETLQRTGVREEQVQFATGARLIYVLEVCTAKVIEAQFAGDTIRIRVPSEMARNWASSDQVAMSSDSAGGNGPSVLIEKDFQCLHRESGNNQEDVDAFPNPEALRVNRD